MVMLTLVFVEPISLVPQPRPDNYLGPRTDNVISLGRWTTLMVDSMSESHVYRDVLTPWKFKLGKSKIDNGAAEGDVDVQDDIDLDGLSRMASTALGHAQPAVPSEDCWRMRRGRRFSKAYLIGPYVPADKGKAPMPDLDIPAEFLAEDAQARQRLEEEQASERLVQRLRAEDLAQEDLQNVSEERAKELDDPHNERGNIIERKTMLRNGRSEPFGRIYSIELLRVKPLMKAKGSYNPVVQATPMAGFAASNPAGGTFDATGGILDFFLDSDEEERIGMSRVVADPNSDDEVFAEIIFRGKSISGDGVVFVDKLPDDEIKYDVGLELEGVNMLCQSLHSDDAEDFWRTQDEWIVSSWQLYPKSSIHVLDLTNGKTVLCCGTRLSIRATCLNTVQTGLRQAYECLASAPIACTARQMVFSSPWLTAKKESGSPTAKRHFGCWLVQEGTALGKDLLKSVDGCQLASPEQTATGKDMSNPLYGCDSLPKTVRPKGGSYLVKAYQIYLCCCKDWKLLFFDVATSFDSAVHRVHAVSFEAAVFNVAATVSDAAGSLCICCSSSIPANYVPAGHVLISADRYRIC
ncbi:hypothetical protein Tco_0762203 [Tanacetum coccineum]